MQMKVFSVQIMGRLTSSLITICTTKDRVLEEMNCLLGQKDISYVVEQGRPDEEAPRSFRLAAFDA